MAELKKDYNPDADYCADAKRFQAVPSEDAVKANHPDWDAKKIEDTRKNTNYSCEDNYQMASIQDNKIYVATTDDQHNQLIKGEEVVANGGLSGYFSDKATIDECINKDVGSLDNTKYNEWCQIAPYNNPETGVISYKPHVDCFEIDRKKLQEVYGTTDFNAAIAKCEVNNQFGCGGGNQGYNPHISELIQNECLVHRPKESYSDPSLCSRHCNSNVLANSTVSQEDYADMRKDVLARSGDCVKNGTSNPSETVQQATGIPHNENPVASQTGHGVPVNATKEVTSTNQANTGPSLSEIKQPQKPDVTNTQSSCGANQQDLPPIQPPHSTVQNNYNSGPDKISAINSEGASDAANKTASTTSDAAEDARHAAKSMTGGIT